LGHLNVAATSESDALATGIGQLVQAANETVRELIAECPPGDPIGTRLALVERTMRRLTLLTGQLNTVGRGIPGRATPLNLNSVVSQLSPSLQRLLGPFITLECALHPDGVWAAGDRGQMEHVALGLVINAREALPLGGAVHLGAHRWTVETERHYRVGSLPVGDWAVLEVRDNGSGIDERAMRYLLEPSLSGLPFDSSLSLATVAMIVRDAGGQMVLDTGRATGTSLAACFPMVRPPRARQPATGTANAILVIDDDEWARMSGARILRRAGFSVLEAEHGDAAIELLDDVAGSCVRLVLVAADLPQQGANPLIDRFHAERPEIEIVLTRDIHSQGSAADFSGVVLAKPFVADTLVKVVAERLARPA
jgi:two-component system cell cycle sensor histidine kinase/response regulator CckA